MIDDVLITTIVCQAELFARAANDLEAVIAQLPQSKVAEVRNKIGECVNQGGVQQKKEEKTEFQKSFAILTGKAVPSDFKKEKDAAGEEEE